MAKKLALFDLALDCRFSPPLSEVLKTAIPRQSFLGVLGHPSEILEKVDFETDRLEVLIIFSDKPRLNSAIEHRHWGYGLRSGRDVRDEWLHIIFAEDRVDRVIWVDVQSGATTSHGKDSTGIEVGGVGLLLQGCDLLITRREADATKLRHRDADAINPSADVELWHGSPNQNLQRLVMAGGRVWASTCAPFATCFSLNPYSNSGFFQGIDRVNNNGRAKIYVVIPEAEKLRLERPCSLYRSHAEMRELSAQGVRGYEYILRRDLMVEEELKFARCREALDKFEVEVIILSMSKILNPEFERLCWEFRYAVEAFVGLPLEVALRLQCKQWALKLWLIARGRVKCGSEDVSFVADAIYRAWMPAIASISKLPEFGYHSLQHLVEVTRFAVKIAVEEGCNPVIAGLIAIFHDIGRVGDEDESAHALVGKAMIEKHFQRELSYLLWPQDLSALKQGVADHAIGTKSAVHEIGAAWDADRLRLAWERGLQEKYFSTRAGLKFASSAENAASSFV